MIQQGSQNSAIVSQRR
ncbi:hypothetical protein [Rhodopseudomonas sp. P1]